MPKLPEQMTDEEKIAAGWKKEGEKWISPTSGNPSPEPPAPTPDPRDAALERALAVTRGAVSEMNRMAERMENLEKRITAPPSEPVKDEDDIELTAEQAKNLMFNDPMKLFEIQRKRTIKDLARTVAPLIEFTKGVRAETAYDRAKKKLASDPRFKEVWPSIEPYVDSALANQPNVDEKTVQAAALGIVGAARMGMIEGFSLDGKPNPTPNKDNDTFVPPHLRSSAPPGPSEDDKNKPKIRELTETEKRLARESKLTDEEYVELMDADAIGFMTKKKKKEEGK